MFPVKQSFITISITQGIELLKIIMFEKQTNSIAVWDLRRRINFVEGQEEWQQYAQHMGQLVKH